LPDLSVPFAAALFLLALACPAGAQQQPPVQQPPAQQPPTQEAQDPDRPVSFEEQVVVTASRTDQEVVNAPASVSLVTAETIQNSPATNIGELLRAVPGINVAQLTARDVNLTTRGATSTLATSQLALVDGRSVYLDFFGMVMWDLVPTNASEIKQIEVIRGPASAVWGANAMSGVVNVITMSPRELAADGASSLTVGGGFFDRDTAGEDNGTGGLFHVNGTHAEAVNDRWSYKLSAGFFTQDALPRPTGTIPNSFNTPYPPYPNSGTSQPKFDARVDYEMAESGRLAFSGGVAGTEGIIHSGIGPFDIESGSRLTYFSGRYQKGGRHIGFFTNILNGDAVNFLSREPSGAFLPLLFDTTTFDIEASDLRTIGTRHVVSFGGNFRHNGFDISIAPNGDDRNEGGAYVQDEIFLTDRFRWVVGGRLDMFSSIDNPVFSPRTTLMYKPSPNQTVRASFNRAFRAPSFINNNLDVALLNQVNLSLISPALSQFVFPFRAVGNPDLEQETMTAYEIGYTGVLNRRATVTAAVYWNTTDDAIFFTQADRYTAANPPVTWPPQVPTFVLDLIPPPGLPSLFTYRNLGTVKDKGIELGVDGVVNRYLNVTVNYSYQADPDVEGFDPSETNFPANNRFNAGFNANYSRYLGNLVVAGPHGDEPESDQPVERRGAAAHLRRHHQAAGRRGNQVLLLTRTRETRQRKPQRSARSAVSGREAAPGRECRRRGIALRIAELPDVEGPCAGLACALHRRGSRIGWSRRRGSRRRIRQHGVRPLAERRHATVIVPAEPPWRDGDRREGGRHTLRQGC
jgi:iron complex outermembrane receptor protein